MESIATKKGREKAAKVSKGMNKAAEHYGNNIVSDVIGSIFGKKKKSATPPSVAKPRTLRKTTALDRYGSNLAKRESGIAKRRAASPGMTREQAEELDRHSNYVKPSAKVAKKKAKAK